MTFHALAETIYPVEQHTRKPASYLAIHDRLFGPMRDKPLSLLEIGIHSGHSLHLWHKYFPKAQITGLDMRPQPEDLPDDRVTYVQGRQEDPGAIGAAAQGGPFDIIIDDASHIGRLTKATFGLLFADHLAPGGVYVLEDLAASTTLPDWPDYKPMTQEPDSGDDFPSYSNGMVGFLKQLIDQVATGTGNIASVDVYPSIAVIHKR